ncbi:MAG: alpha/beta fold hydrolase [Polyangiaceae bacterium]
MPAPESGKRSIPPQTESPPARAKGSQALPLPLRAVKLMLNGVERLSPRLAARVLLPLMFRTRRGKPSPREQALLAGGERWEFAGPRGKLVAHRFGRGERAVVLMHGWNGRGGQLGEFIAPLLSRGYQVVSFDAPGHGESPGNEASMIAFADTFDRVVAAVRESGANVHGVIAHSLGAAAVTLSEFRRLRAARHGGNQRGVGSLVFVAPPIDVREWVDEFVASFALSRRTEHVLRGMVQARVGYRLADLYAPDMAREMRAPLLVLHDADDRAVPLQCGQALAAAWPKARLTTSSGLGHVRILRDDASIRQAVEFIGLVRDEHS